jgi:hypothetical protein
VCEEYPFYVPGRFAALPSFLIFAGVPFWA